MSRFLVVVPPFTGHVNPVLGVAAELRSRGHAVAWVGDETVLPGDWPVYGCGRAPLTPRPPELRGFAALKHLWEQVLAPLAEWMAPTVARAIAEFAPDVVLADQQALAGALIAERAGLVWATSATTSSELTDPLAAVPKAGQWLAGVIAALRQRLNTPGTTDPRFSPRLVLAFTSAELAGEPAVPVRFVGPVPRPVESTEFPWARLDPARAQVLVTMGTANTDATGRFLRECVAALRTRPGLQAVVADPDHVLSDVEDDDDLVRLPWLPVPALLPHVSAVICHAGHNTVCEALAQAVPLVLAPIRDDQPIIAQQVANAGAGVRLRFTHARAEHIGKALDQILTDPAYATAAVRIRDSFTAAGGAPAAATALENLAHH